MSAIGVLRGIDIIYFMESLEDGVFITNSEGRILFVNEAYERITGIPKNELLGKTVRNALNEGFFDKSVTIEVLRTKGIVKEIESIKKTNKKAMVTSKPIYDEKGNIIMVATIVRDITELDYFQKRLEMARKIEQQYRLEKESWYQDFSDNHMIISQSKEMQKIVYLARKVANIDTTVLITGESGVGKGVVAKLIHFLSDRRNRPFMKIDCGAIPENLIESELFGYEKGAFTDAKTQGKIGLVELAAKGTVFLDEIGELPLLLQTKILRLVEDKEYIKVGGCKTEQADIRILAATNRKLHEMVEKGMFRRDLYYRLNVFPINIPPLRQRKDDILPLAHHFLNNLINKHKIKKRFSREVLEFFVSYNWPGNVRQLQNTIEQLYIISEGELIFKEEAFINHGLDTIENQLNRSDYLKRSLREQVDEYERSVIKKALEESKSIESAAEMLGIHRSTLFRKVKRLGVEI